MVPARRSRREPLPTVVAGTRNRAKVAEYARLLGGFGRVVTAPSRLAPPEDETGATVETVAAAKAVAWSHALGTDDLVLAGDGGLLIPSLGAGWDPLRTRRFAGADADPVSRADALLALTAHLDGERRRIGWREAVALARSGRVLATFTAESPSGLLARDYDPDRLDADGFWVPALWICPEYGGLRLADLTAAERDARVDHWARLATQVRAALPGIVGQEGTMGGRHEAIVR